MTLPRITSSTKILVGLVSGVIVGLFFGEHAGVLKGVADGFVKLLQMMVLPYITISIITSLGTLRYDQLKTLGLRAGAVLIGLWCFALIFTFLIPLAFPKTETATFFSATLVERRPPFNFVDLFIPSNPFYSLGQQHRSRRGPVLRLHGCRVGWRGAQAARCSTSLVLPRKRYRGRRSLSWV